MGKKIKRIAMPPKTGICQQMAKIFNCTPQTVSNALMMKTNGDRADRIRNYAIEHGGTKIY